MLYCEITSCISLSTHFGSGSFCRVHQKITSVKVIFIDENWQSIDKGFTESLFGEG